jgi:hypothetical protein
MKSVVIKKYLFLSILISFGLSSCAKKEVPPCFKEQEVSNCTELFEKIQQNLGDMEKSQELRDCYDKGCR